MRILIRKTREQGGLEGGRGDGEKKVRKNQLHPGEGYTRGGKQGLLAELPHPFPGEGRQSALKVHSQQTARRRKESKSVVFIGSTHNLEKGERG